MTALKDEKEQGKAAWGFSKEGKPAAILVSECSISVAVRRGVAITVCVKCYGGLGEHTPLFLLSISPQMSN